MQELKQKIIDAVVKYKPAINTMSDYIYDNPELGFEEVKACAYVTDVLEKEGFAVERGIAGIGTAFRATYEQGTGGVSIGLLAEYDALAVIGHACTHHIQSGIMVYAAKAVSEVLKDAPYKLVIYGTPAEESGGGKCVMADAGYFRDVDVTLMVHGWRDTIVDSGNLSAVKYDVTFFGKSSHASAAPEEGISSFDAMQLAMHGVEFYREHVRDDVRMHYTILDAGGPANVVPEKSVAEFILRAETKPSLDKVIERFTKILDGACLMTGATYEMEQNMYYIGKIPIESLNDILLNNARALNAPRIMGSESNRGASDFGNVMYEVPGSVLRIACVPEGSGAHSKAWLDEGKTDRMHDMQVLAAQILAGVCYDLIENPAAVAEMKETHARKKAAQLAAAN